MDMDGFGSRVLKRSTYLIYREPVMFTGFKLFYKMTIGIIQKCTLLKSCCNSHQNQATFNFNNLPSHENYFACLFLEFCYGRLPIQIKRNPATDRSKYLLRIKSNKIIAPKVTNDAATILSKKGTILCYHNIKDFDAVLAQ
jgi:hypothetical protein